MEHSDYLEMALREAELGAAEGALPVGTVIVSRSGEVLSKGRNRVLLNGDRTAHAEVDAIRNARDYPVGGKWRLYTSAEPCLMCLGAILLCPVEMLVWATRSVLGGGYDMLVESGFRSQEVSAVEVLREPSSEHRARSRELLRAFYLREGLTRERETIDMMMAAST